MTAAATRRLVVGHDRFTLPALPAGASPELAAAIYAYWNAHVGDDGERWAEAARHVHAIPPKSLADIAAKLIVAIHYRVPETHDGWMAVSVPPWPENRLAVEMELDALDDLLANVVLPERTLATGTEQLRSRLDRIGTLSTALDLVIDDARLDDVPEPQARALRKDLNDVSTLVGIIADLASPEGAA